MLENPAVDVRVYYLVLVNAQAQVQKYVLEWLVIDAIATTTHKQHSRDTHTTLTQWRLAIKIA
jgi:hypothetical protein